MKLWYLCPNWEGMDEDEYGYSPYCNLRDVLVRAETEEQARQLVLTVDPWDSNKMWLDSRATICKEIVVEGPAEVLIQASGTG